MALIEVEHLRKSYTLGGQTVRALDDVSLSIDEGEFVAIMGASGSGKSTLMNMLGCLDRPDSGSYRLAGEPVQGMSKDELAAVRNLFLAGTALAMVATGTGAHAQETTDEAAVRFGARADVLDISLSPSGNKIVFISAGPGHTEVVNVIDFNLNVAEATHQPRIFQAATDTLEVEPNFNPDTVAARVWATPARADNTPFGHGRPFTRRQLERLFRLHLNDTPSNFYLGLRLEKARQLLRQSDMSVLEVGLACGFESPSYFSRSYKAHFGVTPSEDRHERLPHG